MYILIVNKEAGSGRGLQLLQKLENDPLYKNSYCRTFLTEYPGHAEKIASQVAEMQKEQLQAVIVVGGDGTFHEVVNGLKYYPETPLGFLPTGAGNDFARGVGIKGKNEFVFQKIIKSTRPASFWTGSYSTDYRSEKHARRFVNSIGFGFDGEVVQQSAKGNSKQRLVKMRLDFLVYTLSFIKTLRQFTPYSIKLSLDGEVHEFDNVWLVIVSVHPYVGGGMKVNPNANMASNELGVLLLQGISKRKVLALFASVFLGRHLFFKEVTDFQATNVEIMSNKAIPYQVDGQAGICKYCQITKDKQERKIFTSSGR